MCMMSDHRAKPATQGLAINAASHVMTACWTQQPLPAPQRLLAGETTRLEFDIKRRRDCPSYFKPPGPWANVPMWEGCGLGASSVPPGQRAGHGEYRY